MALETKIIENFLTDEQIDLFRSYDGWPTDTGLTYGISEGSGTGTIDGKSVDIELKVWGLNRNSHSQGYQILEDLIAKHIGPNITIQECHILTSYFPYRAHTDGVDGEYGLNEKVTDGYTLVIPLDDYDSCTITFDQIQRGNKSPDYYMENNDPVDTIDKEFYDKYLSEEAELFMRYLSVETVYPWKKNSCLIMDRHRWHASDNFYGRIPEKKAVIIWSTIDVT